MPIALLLLLLPLTKAIARIAVGVPVAVLVYYFLQNTLTPVMAALESEIYSNLNQLSSLATLAFQTVQFLDFSHCVSLVLSTASACLSIKTFITSVRAFGVNV